MSYLPCWTLLILQPLWCHAGSIIMDVTPSNGKTAIGSQVSVVCQLQNSRSGESLIWLRRQGNISYKLGSDNILTVGGDTVQRYRLDQDQSTDKPGNFRLTITDARLEDSATFECQLSTDSSVKASKSLIVCGDTSSTFCSCMVAKGWASPDCFASVVNNGVAEEADGLWKNVVGLIIAFLVVFAYSLFMLLVWKRESLRECCCQEEQTEDMKNLNGKSDSEGSDVGQPDPSDSMSDSATCSTSDPSSSGGSDGQGSSQSAVRSRLNGHKMPSDEPGEQQGTPKTTNQHRNRKVETSFTTQPQIHHNEGYAQDGLPHSPTSQRRGKTPPSQLPPPQSSDPVAYDDNFKLKASSLAGQGAFGEVAYRNFNAQSNYSQPMISTVSGSVAGSMLQLAGDQTQQNMQNYYAPSSVVSLHRSQSQLDMEATEI